MKVYRVIAAIGAGVVAVPVGLCVALYAVLVLVNLRDRPPSAAALELERIAAGLPDVADEENGFVYALGLQAPRDADPVAVGREHAQRIRETRDAATAASGPAEPPIGAAGPGTIEDPAWRSFTAACGDDGYGGCFDALAAGAASIDPLLAEHAWRLERYRALLARPAWRELVTTDAPVATRFSGWLRFEGRLLHFLEAWRHAERGDAAAVRALLEDDLAFWRRAARESDTLLTKMVLTSYVGRHFRWGSVVLARLPAERVRDAIPPSWDEPFDSAERSMRRVFAGELAYMQSMTIRMKDTGDLFGATRGARERSFGERFDAHLMRRLF